MGATPLLSVVVPTSNKPERLLLALHSLIPQTLPPERFEPIVVLDDCGAETRESLCAAEAAGLALRALETRRIGQAAARNLGARQARGEILLFMDDDVLLSPGYLAVMADGCSAGVVLRAPVYLLSYLAAFRDPEHGIPYPGARHPIAVSALRDRLVTRAAILGDWPSVARQCIHGNRFERLVAETLEAPQPEFPWLGYSGSGVALRRELFEAAGGYDEAFGLDWGAEAIELGYRLGKRGTRFAEAPGIFSAHMDHPRADSLKTFEASFDRFFAKHGDPAIRQVQALIGGDERRVPVSPAA